MELTRLTPLTNTALLILSSMKTSLQKNILPVIHFGSVKESHPIQNPDVIFYAHYYYARSGCPVATCCPAGKGLQDTEFIQPPR